ncbi:hypothetical protein [Actinomadura formosensis]|uniref:hypothetical protein n=1 Tax=Actinomadura formosensis TaxID=60706 RepID=UPI003D901283
MTETSSHPHGDRESVPSVSRDKAADPNDFRRLYHRPPDAFIVRGDQVEGRTVAGLGPGKVMYLEADSAGRHTSKPVPKEECGATASIVRSGPHPTEHLAPHQVHAAADLVEDLPRSVDDELAKDPPLARFVMERIEQAGHHVWLVGGWVRDVVMHGARARPKDLDMTGTMMSDELKAEADRTLVDIGLGDLYTMTSKNFVYSVAPALDKPRLLEYKTVQVDGLGFPAYGGDLLDDVVCRDLTINSLYYDHRHRIIIDPSGSGIDHARARPCRLATPFRTADPARQAAIVMRFLKFRMRLEVSDASEFERWARELPEDMAARIPEEAWPQLHGLWRRCVPRDHRSRAFEEGTLLGPAVAGLMDVLKRRST